MNHDYCHCLDYDEATCPRTCFRAKLTKEYRERYIDFVGIPVTWANLKNTQYCEFSIPKVSHLDKIRTITDAEEMTDYLLEIYNNVMPMFKHPEMDLEHWLKQEEVQ